MSSPYGPNDPQGGYSGPQQPYEGSYGQRPPQQQGYPQQGQPRQAPYGPPGQAPYGAPGQQPYGASPQSPYGQHQGGPGQFGAPGGSQFGQRNGRNKSKTPLVAALVGVVSLVAAIVLVMAFWVPGFATQEVLNADSVQQGVQTILTDTYKIADVSSVSCPAGQEVTSGATFMCTATVAGSPTEVKVTITDDNGTYQVSRP